jgi:hypothetical protein
VEPKLRSAKLPDFSSGAEKRKKKETSVVMLNMAACIERPPYTYGGLKVMKNKSIFTRQNQTLIDLFRDAKHLDKVLCIPLDYAKTTHMALCCNGAGMVLKKAFPVKNSPEGMV